MSGTALQEGDRYDMSAVRVRVLDEQGNIAPYAQLPILLHCEGAVELVGPAAVTAEGGMTGCYVRSCRRVGMGSRVGKGRLTISCPQTEPVTIEFTVNG